MTLTWIEIEKVKMMGQLCWENKVWINVTEKVLILTHKQLEMHECLLSIVDTDALVQMHQGISIHCTDWIFIVLDLVCTESKL